MPFLDDGGPLHEVPAVKNDDENEGAYEPGVRYGKGDSKRTTHTEFYRFLLQVSQFIQIRGVLRPLPLSYSGLASVFFVFLNS